MREKIQQGKREKKYSEVREKRGRRERKNIAVREKSGGLEIKFNQG